MAAAKRRRLGAGVPALTSSSIGLEVCIDCVASARTAAAAGASSGVAPTHCMSESQTPALGAAVLDRDRVFSFRLQLSSVLRSWTAVPPHQSE